MFQNLPVMPTMYLAYATIGIALTIWVARQLRIHGRVFLAKGCKGNSELSSALSHLLSVGFYLFHVGLILLVLKLGGHVNDSVAGIELLSTKIGFILVVLAISHFLHMALFVRIYGKPRPETGTPNSVVAGQG